MGVLTVEMRWGCWQLRWGGGGGQFKNKFLLFSNSVWYGNSIFCYFPSPDITLDWHLNNRHPPIIAYFHVSEHVDHFKAIQIALKTNLLRVFFIYSEHVDNFKAIQIYWRKNGNSLVFYQTGGGVPQNKNYSGFFLVIFFLF